MHKSPLAAVQLSHFDQNSGRVKMVDVSSKTASLRVAIARGVVHISQELADILSQGAVEKGDALTVSRTAGIMAAKKTGELIPMCHPLGLDLLQVDMEYVGLEVRIEATAKTTAPTGVEMEALTAVSVAALTFYDMCKAVDKRICIERVGLYKKTGGKSGPFVNPAFEWNT